ncbi:MAG: hypothetical protein HZC25_17140 [Rhodospirillales bacterium]|nr:hypothetical protein [Rhodospirillales bacterium]
MIPSSSCPPWPLDQPAKQRRSERVHQRPYTTRRDTTYRALGLDLKARHGTQEAELPIPATYVIDREGLVRMAFVEPDFTQRLDPELVLHALTWYVS